jgi:hypothetical protein
MEIPPQYQGVMFTRELLSDKLPREYGVFVQSIVDDVKRNVPLTRNVLLCAPPNSGKTVFAYTCYGLQYNRGVAIPKLMDLLEAREKLQALYNVDIEAVELISKSPVAFFKIPMDLPNRFGEIMSTILERRVRNGGATIFLYNGTITDLKALDKFQKFQSLIGDGNYNSLLVKSYSKQTNE